MSAFDNIIGYADIKKKLARTADVLAHPDAYRSLGARAPRALLLYGEPGVGKTLMARCLIEESGRAVFTCRKDEPGEQFIATVKDTFAKAVEHTPSIVLLDDMDKFANEDEVHRDASEYVTVQSCIDNLGSADVFVLATANDISRLPSALLRSGRLGNRIEVDSPQEAEAEQIISHYLSHKSFMEDVDTAFLARIMGGHSCADLEEAVNHAGLLAGYERCERIGMEHLVRAILQTTRSVPDPDDMPAPDDERSRLERTYTAYHEAGHAVVSEALDQGSVTLVTLYNRKGDYSEGFALSKTVHDANIVKKQQSHILISLGSKAALEHRFGIVNRGIESDLASAFAHERELVGDTCCSGLHLYAYDETFYRASESLNQAIEQTTAAEIERHYRMAKEIVSQNSRLLNAIATALLEQKLITAMDIERIERACPVVPAIL